MLKILVFGRRFSLRRELMLLVIACVLPASLVSSTLAYSAYTMERDHVEQETLLVARTVLADLERDFATVEASLKILATAPELVSGDLRGFHRRATSALASGNVYSYILTDSRGRQILNTAKPFGEPLPSTGTPDAIGRVFTDRITVLTDVFIGPVVQRLVVAMGVPVVVGGQVVFSLNIGLDPARASALIARHALPPGWLAAVVDSGGIIVGRSRDAERFVGQTVVAQLVSAFATADEGRLHSTTKDGIDVFTAFTTSKDWRWHVVVGAPKDQLNHDVWQQFTRVMVGILLALSLGLWLARILFLRVLASVRELTEAVLSLSKGEDVRKLTMHLQETQGMSEAIAEAAVAIKQVKFLAQHDALTQLPNRVMFEEFAAHNLAFADRWVQTPALLAIDLDGFKAVNDTQGHAVGDLVLIEVAGRIQQAIRASDIAARIGGDEFIVMLSDVSTDNAMETAQRILAMLSEPYEGVGVPLSASIGLAVYPQCGQTLALLMTASDKAMYAAKNSGRGRVVVAQEAPR